MHGHGSSEKAIKYQLIHLHSPTVWADNRGVCAARESRRRHMNTTANTQTATPRRPSQAQRAQMARSPDTPVSPQKRRRTPSPPPPFPPSAGHPSTPKQKRLNGFTSTPQSLAARKAAIAAALKPPSQASNARIKSIADEIAAVSREQQMALSGNRQLSQTQTSPSAPFRKDVQGSQSQPRSDGGSTTAPLPPSPSPAMHHRTPVHGMGLLHSPGSRLPSCQGAQSEAAYSITDEVRQADMEEDEIEDAVWVEIEPDLEDKQIQTDPIEDDEDFDDTSTVGVWNSQASRAAMSSPTSSIPFTLPATRMDVDNDYSGFGASGSTQLQEPGRVLGPSPAPSLPPQTPSSRRTVSSRAYASGENASEADGRGHSTGTLLTPPGSLQQRDHQGAEGRVSSSTSGPGRDSRIHSPLLRGRQTQRQGSGLDLSQSPSPSKESSGGERSQWQMIQDDPVRVQCCPCRVCAEVLTERLFASLAVLLFRVCLRAAYPSAFAGGCACACACAGESFPRTRGCASREFSDSDLVRG